MNVNIKCKTIFRIRWFLTLLGFLCLLIPGFAIDEEYRLAYFIAIGGIDFIVFVLFIIWPSLKYKYLTYQYDEEKIIIKKGVIFRSETIIPIIQIQDINTFQGPIMMIFKLKSLLISTAGSNKFFTGLSDEEATKMIYEIENSIYYRKKKNEEI